MSIAPDDIGLLIGAIVLAATGGEAFLKSILATANHLRIPRAIAATTLAAFATSSPELTVSTVAAISGNPEIGLGDALGSNVVNIALIFGLALLFGPIRTSRDEFGRDFLLALAIPLLTLAFALDGRIGRSEGGLLLAAFAGWLGMLVRTALRHRNEATALAIPPENPTAIGPKTSLLLGIAGLAALIGAGRLFVSGATGIASSFAVDTYVIGVLVVAIGTSLPELVTVILSRLRGHDDIGVGTLIGSNLFNGLAIVGLAAGIQPIPVAAGELAITLGFGILALLCLIPAHAGVIARWRGGLLLGLYIGFIAITMISAHKLS